MPLSAFVVEDNVALLASLVEALAELGHVETAGTAGTEKAAIAWLQDPANHWDLAVVDLSLEGGGTGFGVLRALRDRGPLRKVVVLTGTASPEVRKRCFELGSDGVFDKSMETEALLDFCAALSRAAGGH